MAEVRETKPIEVFGEGLFGGTVGVPSKFKVKTADCEEYVTSGLVVALDGPSEPEIEFEHLKDGNIAASYLPQVPGLYTLTVKFNGKHVKNSPFRVAIVGRGVPIKKPLVIKRNLVRKVKLSGPGMEQANVNQFNEILIDIARAEINCELMVDISGPSRPQYFVEERTHGMLTLSYKPTAKGEYKMILKFRCEHINGSPLTIQCV